jgi:hypothetical protein
VVVVVGSLVTATVVVGSARATVVLGATVRSARRSSS